MSARNLTLLKRLRYVVEVLIVRLALLVFSFLSIDRASTIGGWLGRKIGMRLAVTNIARKNLQRAMPELSAEERAYIVVGMWDNLGRTIAEFPHVFSMTREEFAARVVVEGAEHLEMLRTSPTSGFIFSGHLGNWEVLPRVATERGLSMALIYRHANNPYVDNFINRLRQNKQLSIFAKGKSGAKDLVSALKKKLVVAMLIDQKMNDGMSVPFFGHPAMTAPAIARLARSMGSPIVPATIVRLGGARFKVTILPPIAIEQTDNSQEDCYAMMLHINQLLESWIRLHPEQWFWLHQRWGKEQS